jgi:hypothetical protein
MSVAPEFQNVLRMEMILVVLNYQLLFDVSSIAKIWLGFDCEMVKILQG